MTRLFLYLQARSTIVVGCPLRLCSHHNRLDILDVTRTSAVQSFFFTTNMSSQRLHGRVAIVTGSSQGIGREICYQFFKEGAVLVCADLKPLGDGEEIATHEWISMEGGKAIFVEVDVSNATSWKKLIGKTVETFGKLDM